MTAALTIRDLSVVLEAVEHIRDLAINIHESRNAVPQTGLDRFLIIECHNQF